MTLQFKIKPNPSLCYIARFPYGLVAFIHAFVQCQVAAVHMETQQQKATLLVQAA